MNGIFKYALILFVNGCLCNFGLSQSQSLNEISLLENGISIPPLQVLIDSTINNNAMVRFSREEIIAKQSDLKSDKNDWTKNFGIRGEGTYGNFNNNSLRFADNTTNLTASSTTQLNYTAGLYFKLPLFDVLNRKNQMQRGKVELSQAKILAEAQVDEIRQIVIKQYEDLVVKQKLLGIQAKNLGNAKVNMEMVEKEFSSGVISIYEYVRLSDLTSRIKSDYENAKSNFLLSKKLMENLIGFSLNTYQSN